MSLLQVTVAAAQDLTLAAAQHLVAAKSAPLCVYKVQQMYTQAPSHVTALGEAAALHMLLHYVN